MAGIAIIPPMAAITIGMTWLSMRNWGAATILNSTQESITGGYVLLHGERFTVAPMRPGDMHRIFFKIRGSTSARAVLRLASGSVVCGDGRLTGFFIIDDTIGVVPEGVYFSTPGNRGMGGPCPSDGLPPA